MHSMIGKIFKKEIIGLFKEHDRIWVIFKVDTWKKTINFPWAPFPIPLKWNHSPFDALYKAMLDHFIIYAHNIYLYFEFVRQSDHTVQITIVYHTCLAIH